jgi:hypothetical protein
MDNMIVVLVMVMASIVANPFLSAQETKKTKPVTEITDNADVVDAQDDVSEDDDAVKMEDETESN